MRVLPVLAHLLLGLFLASPTIAHEHPLHHDFSEISTWIARFEDPERESWQKPDLVVQLLGLRPGQNVADIGAGTGYFTRRLARPISPGGIAIAVDIEAGFFPYVQQRALDEGQDNLFTHRALPHNPRLAPETFDLIFLCNTLHHIAPRGQYYAHLRRALRPGGRLVVVDFFKEMEIPVGPKPSERLASSQLRTELEAAGFQVSVDAESLPYQYIVTATKAD